MHADHLMASMAFTGNPAYGAEQQGAGVGSGSGADVYAAVDYNTNDSNPALGPHETYVSGKGHGTASMGGADSTVNLYTMPAETSGAGTMRSRAGSTYDGFSADGSSPQNEDTEASKSQMIPPSRGLLYSKWRPSS